MGEHDFSWPLWLHRICIPLDAIANVESKVWRSKALYELLVHLMFVIPDRHGMVATLFSLYLSVLVTVVSNH
jgi:hypothetical protein